MLAQGGVVGGSPLLLAAMLALALQTETTLPSAGASVGADGAAPAATTEVVVSLAGADGAVSASSAAAASGQPAAALAAVRSSARPPPLCGVTANRTSGTRSGVLSELLPTAWVRGVIVEAAEVLLSAWARGVRLEQEVLLSAWIRGVRLDGREVLPSASERGVRLNLRVVTQPIGWKLLLCGSAAMPSSTSGGRTNSFIGEFSGTLWSSDSGTVDCDRRCWNLGGDCSGGFRSDGSGTVLELHVHGLPRKSTPVPPHERHRAASLVGPVLDSLGRPTALRARATAAAATERGEDGTAASAVAAAEAVAEDEDEGCAETNAKAVRSSVDGSEAGPKEGGFDGGVLGVQVVSSIL